MTQYSFLITFYECELEMLQKAFTQGRAVASCLSGRGRGVGVGGGLASYLEVCEREIANGARAPFADEKDMIELIREAMKIESSRGAIDFDLWRQRMDSKLKRKE